MFTAAVDIANRACQRVGAQRINALTDASRQATEINFCYDKLRRAELRRSTWAFATRRATLRAITATSVRFIPAAYASGTTYAAGAIVQDTNGIYWISSVGSNTGNTPGNTTTGQPAYWQQYFGPVVCDIWSNATAYYAGDLVIKAGVFYLCTTNGSTGNDPVSGAPWVTMPGSPTSQAVTLLEPAGPGMTVAVSGGNPSSLNRNKFPLPYGYLRMLPPDPKVANTSTLGTSGALRYLDYQVENGYIISANAGPIFLRYVADVSDVTAMDDLFCEGLAARVAYEICETLTQSNIKLQAIGAAYQKFVKDARLVNWIETGSTEPQEEEYELTGGPAHVAEGSPTAQGA